MIDPGDELVRPRETPSSTVGDLASWLAARGLAPRVLGDPGVEISGLSLSSLRIRPGDLYAAVPGSQVHGAEYAEEALAAGARAVFTDEPGADLLPAATTGIVVQRPRAVLGLLSARVYGDPAHSLRLIGVTGTQGKTTTTWLAQGALSAASVPSAVVGTVGTRIRDVDVKTALTTPEAPDLHALFAVMREQGVEVCLMEVSSHALVLGRVDGVIFDLAVFTNLGRDHLDFHRDIEAYFAAKASLFTSAHARRGLVNLDDPYGRRLAAEAAIPIRTFSSDPARATDGSDLADWQTLSCSYSPDGTVAVVRAPDGVEFDLEVSLPGRYNLANAVAGIAACGEIGEDPVRVASGLRTCAGVPGRMEWITAHADGSGVVVDYAHKPDALRAALESLRERTPARLIVVLGAGGDRDQGKRPLMGAVAAELADLVVLTDDNPRTEDPAEIRAAIRSGIAPGTVEVHEVADRRAAIATAIALARSGDVVLIAGKGHETGQEVAGAVLPFDDRSVAREVLGR